MRVVYSLLYVFEIVEKKFQLKPHVPNGVFE